MQRCMVKIAHKLFSLIIIYPKIFGMNHKLTAAIAFIFSFNCCVAQLVGTGMGANQTVRRIEVYSWATRPDEDGTDLQKKFIKQEWTDGIVKFRSGRPDMHVPLLFDIFDNTLYYLQDSVIMEFVDSVLQVTFFAKFNQDTVQMLFRRFYPSIQANTPATFYRVLVDGKMQLLRCDAKSTLLFKDSETPEEKKKDPTRRLYFACMPNGKLVQIAPDADKLVKAMPGYGNLITEILKRERLKPKDENRMAQLFIHLNNELENNLIVDPE